MLALRSLSCASLAFSLCLGAHAHAQDQDCPIDENCEPRIEHFDITGDWQWNVGAEVLGVGRMGSDTGAQSDAVGMVDASLAYAGSNCRWFAFDGDLGGYRDPTGQGLTGRQQLTACIPLPVFRPEFTASQELALRPRLSAAPLVRAGRVRRAELGFNMYPVEMTSEKDDIRSTIRFAGVSARFGYSMQDVDDQNIRVAHTSVSVMMVEALELETGFLGADRRFSLFPVNMEIREDPSVMTENGDARAVAIDFSIFEFDGGRIPRTDLFFDIAGGLAVGQLFDENGESGTFQPHIFAQIYGGSNREAAGISYQHTVLPTNYTTLLIEDRLSAWWRRGSPRSPTTVHGFAAFTRLFDGGEQQPGVATGGVAVDHDMNWGRYAYLTVGAELARSFYDDLHGGAAASAGWVAQVNLRTRVATGSNL